MEAEAVKRAVKDIVLRHAPDAEVILYGSRARGDAQPDSDWDILVLLPKKTSNTLERTTRRDIYEWEWANDEVITVIFREKTFWNSPVMKASPFHQNVTREGVRL